MDQIKVGQVKGYMSPVSFLCSSPEEGSLGGVTALGFLREQGLSMGIFQTRYWSGLLFPSPRDLPDPEMEPASSALQEDSLPLSP